VTPPAWRAIWIILSLALLAASLAAYLLRPKPPPRLTLAPASYDALRGWRDDALAVSLPALLRSCKAALAKPDGAPLDAWG
jgi:hypothetical protein